MVNDGFDLEKDLKMCMIVTDPILRQLCVFFEILIIRAEESAVAR